MVVSDGVDVEDGKKFLDAWSGKEFLDDGLVSPFLFRADEFGYDVFPYVVFSRDVFYFYGGEPDHFFFY